MTAMPKPMRMVGSALVLSSLLFLALACYPLFGLYAEKEHD
jgi:hypothetical protein